MRTAGHDALARFGIRTALGEPVLVEVHRVVHRAARLADHAAQRQILERRAKAAAGMSLDVREIDQEGRILNQARHFPLVDVLVRTLVRVEIFLVRAGRREDRAADRLRRIAALFRAARVPVDVGDERLAAAIFDRLDDLAHEDRMHRRVTDIVAGVHFDRDGFILHSIAQVRVGR